MGHLALGDGTLCGRVDGGLTLDVPSFYAFGDPCPECEAELARLPRPDHVHYAPRGAAVCGVRWGLMAWCGWRRLIDFLDLRDPTPRCSTCAAWIVAVGEALVTGVREVMGEVLGDELAWFLAWYHLPGIVGPGFDDGAPPGPQPQNVVGLPPPGSSTLPLVFNADGSAVYG